MRGSRMARRSKGLLNRHLTAICWRREEIDMNVVILGVLSTKFAAAAGGFLTGFSMLLLTLLLLRRRVQVQMRPLLVSQTLRPMDQTWFPARTNTRSLSMARAPPPRVQMRQWMRRQRPRPWTALRS
jgi:hypothetical protein